MPFQERQNEGPGTSNPPFGISIPSFPMQAALPPSHCQLPAATAGAAFVANAFVSSGPKRLNRAPPGLAAVSGELRAHLRRCSWRGWCRLLSLRVVALLLKGGVVGGTLIKTLGQVGGEKVRRALYVGSSNRCGQDSLFKFGVEPDL